MRSHGALAATSLLSLLALTTLVHCSSDEAAGAANGDDAGGGGPGDRDGSSTDDDDGGKADRRTEVAGTRFRPLYLETTFDDGAVEHAYSRLFLDMKLNIACSVRDAGGGAHACLPVTRAIAARGFADASCTVPAAIAVSKLSPGETHLNIGSPCEPKLVALAGGQTGITYQKDGGVCRRFMTDAVFVPNPEILPISTFGTFTREDDTTDLPGERSGTRLTLERSRFRGEDGSLQIDTPRIVDRERDATGRFLRAGDEKLRFFTASGELAAGAGFFADPACTDTAFGLYESTAECQPDPRKPKDLVLQRSTAAGCGTYALVKPITEPPLATYYSNWTGTCAVDRGGDGTKVYRKEAIQELPPTALAEVAEKFVAGPGRSTDGSKLDIRVRSIASPDGLELLSREPTPYLSKFDVPCELAIAGGETTPRCLPRVPIANQPGHEFFSDAACSRPLVTIHVDRCLPLPPLYQDRRKENRVFRRPNNPPLEFDAVYYRSNGACTVERNTKIFAFYPQAAHEEVPLTEFPQATKQKLE